MVGYRIETREVKNVILYLNKDKTVNSVKYAGNFLYQNGKCIASLTDYIITTTEASKIQYNCQEAIKKILKSPSSAKFPPLSEWSMVKKAGDITVGSYVDADNSLGANLRKNFQFIIKADGTISSLIFDSQEYITQKK